MSLKKISALLLTLALLCGVAACDGTPAESSDTSSEESVAEISSEISSAESSEISDEGSSHEESSEPAPPPEPTAAEVFAEAVSLWKEADSYTMELVLETTRYVGSVGYTEELERTVEYVGIGTDGFGARVNSTQTVMENVIGSQELYIDGTAYFSFESEDIAASSALSADAYRSRYLPAVILDPALYENVSYDGKDKSVITFSDPTDLESWLYREENMLINASGSATLNEDGTVDEMRYSVEYLKGPVYFYEFYTVTLSEGTLTAEELVPPSDKEIVETENIDLPMILNYASLMLSTIPYGSGYVNDELHSEALGVSYYDWMSFDSFLEGDGDPMIKIEDEYSLYTYDFTDKMTWTGVYRDGKTTYTENGKPVKTAYVDYETLSSVMHDALFSVVMMSLYEMDSLTVTDIGDFLILEFDISDDFAKELETYVLSLVLEDPYALEEYVSDFSVDLFTGMLSIDKDKGFLTAASYALEAKHIIEGDSYELLFYRDLFYDIGNMSAYYNITDEVYPDIEPADEEKATPAFYEVTDKDGNKLYLLGTIHVGDDRTAYLPDEIYAALEEADALAVEMNTNTLEERLEQDSDLHNTYMESYFYQDGTRLIDKVGEELYEDACKRMFACGYGSYADISLPVTVDSFYNQYLLESCNYLYYEKGVDQRLLDLADATGKKVYEIEDVKDHLMTMADFSDDLQRWILECTPEYTRAYTVADTEWMYELWCAGDVQAQRENMSNEFPEDMLLTDREKALYEEYNRILVTERDQIMFDGIVNYLASGETVFVAVGATHVLAENGLVDRLTEAGYTVTLVEYQS